MRGFFSKPLANIRRILVVESGPRDATDQMLTFLYATEQDCAVDVLTCYETRPAMFDHDRGSLLSIHESFPGQSRKQILRRLAGADYSVIALPLPRSHVLRKWRIMIALQTRAHILIGDSQQSFWYLRARTVAERTAKSLIGGPRALLRAGGKWVASHAGLLAETIIAPFSLSVLALYAVFIHARRYVRISSGHVHGTSQRRSGAS